MSATKIEVDSNIPMKTKVYAFIFAFLALMADGADVIFLSFSYTSLAADFGLTKTQIGSFGSLTLAGMAIGGALGGWACDRFGRVRAIVWSVSLFSVGTACLGFSQGYWSFAIIRFFSSFGLGCVFLAANTLMSEYISSKHRTTILSILQAGWTVGYIMATILSGWIIPEYGWRFLFFLTTFPIFLAILMKRLVPETPVWLAIKAARDSGITADAANNKQSKTRTSSIKLLLEDKTVFRVFIFWIFTAAFFQFGYYGANNWLPAYLELELGIKFKTMTGYMVGTYTAMIFGKVFAGFAADYLGRRSVFAVGALGTALFIPIIIFYHSPENIMYMMVVFGFLYGMPPGVLGTYMTESFPARLRGVATGWSYNAGRLGAAIAPLGIGLLSTSFGIGTAFLVLGLAYLLTGLVPALFIKSKLYDTNKE